MVKPERQGQREQDVKGSLNNEQRRQRFCDVWQRCLMPGAQSRAIEVFTQLDRLYSSVSRDYHSWGHIDYLLHIFDQMAPQSQCPDTLELAIWFHDAVYDTDCQDNEARSVELMHRLSMQQITPTRQARIAELIMATLHRDPPQSSDACLMVDIDLMSFALPSEQFLENSHKVRRESAHLSDAEFYPGQIRFMRSLVNRKRFFHTDYINFHYEASARRNVDSYLSALQNLGYRAA